MKIRGIIFSILTLVLIQEVVYANGGPVDGSIISGTGQIKLITKENVSLDKELLFISFNGDYANVVVKYTLVNHGKSEKITYAFPVNYNPNSDLAELAPYEECIPYFEMSLNNNVIKDVQFKIDSVSSEGNNYYDKFTKWYFTTVDLKAESPQLLEIKYKVKLDFDDGATSKSAFNYYSLRKFFYDFSPATSWGDGKVKDFRIIINSTELLIDGDSVVTFEVPGNQQFNRLYEANLSNCDLKTLKPVKIELYTENNKVTAELKNSRLNRYQIQSISCSSRGSKESYMESGTPYNIYNLIDGDFNTAWYETAAGDGTGEVLTVDIVENIAVLWVGVINGYVKNKETYYNNPRVKKVKIELFGHDLVVKDEELHYERVTELPDRKYESLNKNTYGRFVDILLDMGDSGTQYTRLKITVLEVYPGKKYKDLCISELLIGGSTIYR